MEKDENTLKIQKKTPSTVCIPEMCKLFSVLRLLSFLPSSDPVGNLSRAELIEMEVKWSIEIWRLVDKFGIE